MAQRRGFEPPNLSFKVTRFRGLGKVEKSAKIARKQGNKAERDCVGTRGKQGEFGFSPIPRRDEWLFGTSTEKQFFGIAKWAGDSFS